MKTGVLETSRNVGCGCTVLGMRAHPNRSNSVIFYPHLRGVVKVLIKKCTPTSNVVLTNVGPRRLGRASFYLDTRCVGRVLRRW